MWDASIDTIAPLNPSSEEVTMALVNLPTFGSRLNTCKMSGGGDPPLTTVISGQPGEF